MRLRFSMMLLLFNPICLYGQGHTSSAVKTEIGTLDNAAYRIDLSKDWNHRLIVYYHGYSEKPVTYKVGRPSRVDDAFLIHGYAVVQSGYSVTGWALARAFPETEVLREAFVSKYGKPSQTYVTGESMGGTLTMMTIEQSPEHYNGALALCGRLDSSNEARQQAFAMRAAFDYYFPGVLPPLDPVPQGFQESEPLRQEVVQTLERNPKSAVAMRALIGLRSDNDVAGAMMFTTYVIKDAQEKAGGNPFDNRNYIYTGSPTIEL